MAGNPTTRIKKAFLALLLAAWADTLEGVGDGHGLDPGGLRESQLLHRTQGLLTEPCGRQRKSVPRDFRCKITTQEIETKPFRNSEAADPVSQVCHHPFLPHYEEKV